MRHNFYMPNEIYYGKTQNFYLTFRFWHKHNLLAHHEHGKNKKSFFSSFSLCLQMLCIFINNNKMF